MQTVAISSFAPGGTHSPAASASTNAYDAPTDAHGIPVFAQAVRDALNRNTTSPASASTSRQVSFPTGYAAAKNTKSDRPPGHAKTLLPGGNTPALATAAMPVSLPDLLATSPTVVPSAPTALAPAISVDHAANGAQPLPPLAVGSEASGTGSPKPQVGGNPDTKLKDGGASLQATVLTLAGQTAAAPPAATSPASVPTSRTSDGIGPTSAIPASETPKVSADSPVTEPAVAASTVLASTVVVPAIVSPTDAATPVASVAAASAPAVVALQPNALKLSDAGSAITTPPVTGELISPLLPQISKLQGNASAARAHVSSPGSADARIPSSPFFQAPEAGVFAHSLPQLVTLPLPTTPKGTQSVPDAAPAQIQSSSSGSTNNGSQDTTPGRKQSGHADSTTASDSSPAGPAARDVSSFSQALVVAVGDKQDAAPATNASLTGQVTSAPASNADHAASSRAPAPQAPPPSWPSTLPLPQPAVGTSNRLVDSAKLVETAGRSEMRIAMDTEKLGPVELRARMVGGEVGAAITVEKHDAHAMLALEMPALQQALSDKQLCIEHVTLLHASLGSTAGDAGTSTRQEPRSSPHPPTTLWTEAFGGSAQGGLSAAQSGIFDSKGRLSVRA